jgi:hypothetical protein
VSAMCYRLSGGWKGKNGGTSGDMTGTARAMKETGWEDSDTPDGIETNTIWHGHPSSAIAPDPIVTSVIWGVSNTLQIVWARFQYPFQLYQTRLLEHQQHVFGKTRPMKNCF